MKGRIGDKQRLEHILAALDEAVLFVKDLSFADFDRDTKTRFASVRAVEIIGEAARHVTDETKKAHPQVPWQQMTGLRNFVIHQYFDVENEVLWKVLTHFLPTARPYVEAAWQAK